MKYFLIHGEDSIKSYIRFLKFIDEAKNRRWDVIYLDDSSLSLAENISSTGLFQQERFFVHRDFKKLPKNDIEWIYKRSKLYSGNIVLYSDTEIPKTSIVKLPKEIKIEVFTIDKTIWKLLDSFYPGNAKNFLTLLHKTAETEAAELIFGLLAKTSRDLYWVKTNPDTLGYPSWRVSKLKNQANKFSNDQLKAIISDLAEADIKSKTSNNNIIDLIDFVIIEKLR